MDNLIPLISIENFSLNIGIEIEVCTTRKSENNINEKNKLKYFIDTTNNSIKCNNGFNGREYIVNGYIKNNKLNEIFDNINSINKNSIECKDNSCGLHFHISSDNILLSIQGLIFIINFILKWNNEYQTEFEDRFFYKKYVGKSYSPSLKLSKKEIRLLKEQKNILIENIKEKIKINKVELLDILKKIIIITRVDLKENNNVDNLENLNKNIKYLWRGKLTVVNDPNFIHFEFRDLLPWALKRTIKNFPALVKEKYLEIIEQTNQEIEAINNNI